MIAAKARMHGENTEWFSPCPSSFMIKRFGQNRASSNAEQVLGSPERWSSDAHRRYSER